MNADKMPTQKRSSCTIDNVPTRPGWNIAWWVVDKVKSLLVQKEETAKNLSARRVGYKICKGKCGRTFKKSDMTQIGNAVEYMFCTDCAEARLAKISAKEAKRINSKIDSVIAEAKIVQI